MKHYLLITALFFFSSICKSQVTYWENGNKKTEGNRNNGKYIEYHENGNIQSEFNYRNGLLNGEILHYYKSGELESKSNFLNNQETGESVIYHENGQVSQKMTYKNGQWNGAVITYYSSGKMKSKSMYFNGKQHGEDIGYFNNGSTKFKGSFINGKQSGDYFEYDENGNLNSRWCYVDGDIKKMYNYYSNGQLSDSGSFVNMVRIGEHKKYYIDGKIHIDEKYDNGKLLRSIVYSQSGQVVREEICKDPRNCETTEYFKNGKLKYKSKKTNDVYVGVVEYDKDGVVVRQEGCYANSSTSTNSSSTTPSYTSSNSNLTPEQGVKVKEGVVKLMEYLNSKNYSAGLSLNNQLISQFPSYYPLYVMRGTFKGALKNYTDAINDLNKLINNSRGFEEFIPKAYYLKAICLFELNDKNGGCELVEKVIQSGDKEFLSEAEKLQSEKCNAQNETNCNFTFKRPQLTFTFVDNRKMCCYCREKYAQYTTKSDSEAKGEETMFYFGELFSSHCHQVKASDQHIQEDIIRLSKFVLDNYGLLSYIQFPAAAGGELMAMKLNEYSSSYVHNPYVSTNRKVNKYNVETFCGPECQDKCSLISSCKCK
jgi:antitoxin component YwqK of YwqJK toxin-antitoxin module